MLCEEAFASPLIQASRRGNSRNPCVRLSTPPKATDKAAIKIFDRRASQVAARMVC